MPELLPLIERLLACGRIAGIEERAGGVVFRLLASDDTAVCDFSCVLHDKDDSTLLADSERAVAGHLCEGLTLAQIARLRGVSVNTVKSQVRQIFRKLNVDTRVAMVRRLCP